MSEETPPAKKAARKSVRKKSATKRAPRKSAAKENSEDQQLPLSTDSESTPTPAEQPAQEAAATEESTPNQNKGREPKSGVRDARTEPSDEGKAQNEVVEKLVDDSDSGEKPEGRDQKKGRDRNQRNQRDDRSNNDQNDRSDNEERRGRNRGRNRNNRERGEKREARPRPPVNEKDLAKKAWKIFESEVTEEGLALLDDAGLREYARSSFNAARLFLEEEGRIIGREEKAKDRKPKKDEDDD